MRNSYKVSRDEKVNAPHTIHAFDLSIHFAPLFAPPFPYYPVICIFEPLPTVYYNNVVFAYSEKPKEERNRGDDSKFYI